MSDRDGARDERELDEATRRRRQAHHERVLKDLEENPDAPRNIRLRARARAIRERQQP